MMPHGLFSAASLSNFNGCLRDLDTELQQLAPAIANHLWQSTAFAAAAGLLTLALRSNSARTRHWIWMAASVKFLLPFALLSGLAAHFTAPKITAPAAPVVYSAVDDFSEPFAAPIAPATESPVVRPEIHLGDWLPLSAAAIWLTGFLAVLAVWTLRWLRVARTIHSAETLENGREIELLRGLEQKDGIRRPIPLLLAASAMEPGIFGIFRPTLMWPAGISQRLDDAHLEAVLAHEVCHVRRRDNLLALLHMLVEAAFWFHPLVWWMGARLVAERERACDEAVLELCARPQVYAESILKVCEFCVESPLECVAGITGADLKRRIVEIMQARTLLRLTWPKRALIGAAALCAIAVPVVMGQAEAARAAQRLMLAAVKAAPKPVQLAAHSMIAEEQAAPTAESDPRADPCAVKDGAKFDVIAIRPSKASSGHWDSDSSADGVSLSGTTKGLIQQAFSLRDFQVVGGPDWITSDTFDIKAKFDPPDNANDATALQIIAERWKQRYGSLLQERFQFKCHMTTKELPVYNLVVAKGGIKLKVGNNEDSVNGHGDAYKTKLVATGVSFQHIAAMLAGRTDRTVVDKTGLTGRYDFTLNWSTQKQAERSAQDGEAALPELPTALEEQLGLKLVPSKGPVPVLVIDHVQKPSVDGAEVAPATQEKSAQDGNAADTVSQENLAQAAITADAVKPAFEVASIKAWDGTGFGIRLIFYIEGAFGVPANSNGLLIGPDWINNTRFVIDAKPPDAISDAMKTMTVQEKFKTMAQMQQSLLADRFKLKAHFETQEMPEYELVVAKGGQKMKENSDTTHSGWGISRTGIKGTAISLPELSKALMAVPDIGGRIVIDKTGLTGRYDVPLKWTPLSSASPGGAENATDPDYGSVFTALEEQLGLKLVPIEGPVPVLVIDHIEQPSPN